MDPLNFNFTQWQSINILSNGRQGIESPKHFNLGLVVKMLICRVPGLNKQLSEGGQE